MILVKTFAHNIHVHRFNLLLHPESSTSRILGGMYKILVLFSLQSLVCFKITLYDATQLPNLDESCQRNDKLASKYQTDSVKTALRNIGITRKKFSIDLVIIDD